VFQGIGVLCLKRGRNRTWLKKKKAPRWYLTQRAWNLGGANIALARGAARRRAAHRTVASPRFKWDWQEFLQA